MAGSFFKGETKVRAGVFSRNENVSKAKSASYDGVGAAVLKSNWGPLGKVIEIKNKDLVTAIFGSGSTVDVAHEMFRGGCISVLIARIGTGGRKGSLDLNDSSNKPAITLTAKYEGDRLFTVSIRDSLTVNTLRECIIYEGNEIFEQVFFAKGEDEPAALKEALAASAVFDAEVKEGAGKQLKAIAQLPVEGGENPASTVNDYSIAFDALEAENWNVLCLDTCDTAVHALAHNYINRVFKEGNRAMCCVAEPISVSMETRMANAAAFNSPLMVYPLNAVYSADGTLYEGWRLAARVGGIIAATPSNTSLTHKEVDDFVALAEPMKKTKIEQAILSGCLTLVQNKKKKIWFDLAVNTLVNPDEKTQDKGWQKIRRTKTRIELNNRIDEVHEELMGQVNNDVDGRATVQAAGQEVINQMHKEKKLLEGGLFLPDPENPPSGDSAYFIIAVDDVDSLEKVYETYQYRFAPN